MHDAGILTLESAIAEAVAWHPSLIEAARTLAARDEDIAAARTGYLPRISAGVGSGYDSRVAGTLRPRPQVGASQMVYDFGKVSSEVAGAQAGAHVSRAEMLLAVDTLIRDTAYALVEYQRAAAQRVVAREQAESIRQISDLVGRRAALGAATRSDALQAEARVEAVVASLATAEADERRWASNLAFLLGREGPPAEVTAEVPEWLMHSCAVPPPAWDTVPAAMIADAQVERSSAALRRNQAERYPTLSLGGDASTDVTSPFGDRGIVNFGLRVSSNVFAGGVTKARVRGATFELDAAQAGARRVRNETSQRLTEAQQQIASFSQVADILASREGNMRETGRLYRIQYLEMGTRTLVDLLNAEQELQQVRFEGANTTRNLRRLQIDCLFLSGRMRDAFHLSGTSLRGVPL
ncbi:transporter [Sphingomonas solaris]|uniref:Transporter n=2 Tax=Alterirhizorhabdus solaris TaxID=2529389 RepID=A0A558RB28_9SPHN|nr:transporter [Sphingomonas solaris]